MGGALSVCLVTIMFVMWGVSGLELTPVYVNAALNRWDVSSGYEY